MDYVKDINYWLLILKSLSFKYKICSDKFDMISIQKSTNNTFFESFFNELNKKRIPLILFLESIFNEIKNMVII